MQPTFKPPVTDEEFRERADKVTMDGARSVLGSLERRREEMLKPIDQEIKYWESVIKYKQKKIDGQTEITEEVDGGE